MNLQIVTGGSRGFGYGLAQSFLSDGDFVINVARTPSNLPLVENIVLDLSSPEQIQKIFLEQFQSILARCANNGALSGIGLVNNAATVAPIRNIENLQASEVAGAISLNLTAPILMTSIFLNAVSGMQIPKTIVNVSSGVAKNPKKSWSVYCATKAALESFSETLCLENQSNPLIRVINFEPGIMDTDMQGIIRETIHSDFDEREKFISFKNNNELLPVDKVGRCLASLMKKENLPQRTFTSIYDLL